MFQMWSKPKLETIIVYYLISYKQKVQLNLNTNIKVKTKAWDNFYLLL